MKILIITGGNIDIDFALDYLENEKFDKVIAVDGGLKTVALFEEKLPKSRFALTHIVGDFDTVEKSVLDSYCGRNDVQIRAYKPEKDYTDTDIALKLAIELGTGKSKCEQSVLQCTPNFDFGNAIRQQDQIVMLGATGTRLDHVLANLQMLRMPMEAGIDAVILDAHNRIRMIEHEYMLNGSFGKYVSLIPVSETLEGVDLEGFKYPLKDKTVNLGESLCVSNELTAETGLIRIRKGRALLIESRD